MTNVQTAFVAYTGRDRTLSEMIEEGVRRANAKSQRVRYEPWVFNDIAGNPLISPIVSGIENSAFVVADVTFLNPNVVYEIGFAIGSKKRAFLVRQSAFPGDKAIAQEAGIFDTLGYQVYEDCDGLCHRLVSHIDQQPLSFNLTLDRAAPVYVVEPPHKNEAATMMTSRLKKARYKYRSFNPSEDIRLSAVDAIRQVAASAGVLVSLQNDKNQDGTVHNIRSLFVAGLAHGMEKPTLILRPADYQAPLDVRDESRPYRHPEDIIDHIAAFALEITDHLQQGTPTPVDGGTLLQSLRIGDPTAENEMTTLAEYYLRTDQYNRALRGEVNLVVGRKGSGKTALFLQVRDKTRNDKRNIVVDLKPEGYQLLKLKEDILSYLTEGARQHLITAFWEYLLLLEVTYKLLEKDQNVYKHNHEIHDIYIKLKSAYYVDNFSVEGDFSERLLSISARIAEEYRAKFGEVDTQKLTTEQVTGLLYSHDIRQLRAYLSEYLDHKQAVWVLFDNLDKGWSTQGVDVIDVISIRCLIEAGRKLERDMRKAGHIFHCVVFVRNDVYEQLMANSADYGKDMRVVLDWTEPDLLREMLRLRLVSGLEEKSTGTKFEQIWPMVCVSHYKGEETSAYIIDRSLMRPRNVLKIFSHSRGFANNFNRQKISEDDIEKGLRTYSRDLLVELDHELSDVFPQAGDLIYCFIDAKSELSLEEVRNRIVAAEISEEDVEKIIDFLLYYGVLGIRLNEQTLYIFDMNYDRKMLQVRLKHAGRGVRFAINPAFWPALGVQTSDEAHRALEGANPVPAASQ